MPSLKPRTPSPIPRINSGILRPPKRISTMTAIISQCIGNSIKPPATYNFNTPCKRREPAKNPAKLEYNTFVALSAGDAFAVQIFQQRNGVFAGDAGQIFECGHRDSLALRLFVGGQFHAQFGQRLPMKDELRSDAMQGFSAKRTRHHLS